ncbi:hypothetical protein MTR_5g429560 [Medicago truncatula]|uniref:Uncharacterized protein n=1 Tax=Medicago truncatula TaxID=3880 RepID=A0A072UDJ2_MEDTR|nr:hypothetical protein MTR_5g429560 [Medicago truncatula]
MDGDKLALPMNAGTVKKYSVKHKSSISRKPEKVSKDLRFEASADQRLGTGAFKVVRENSGYLCSMYPSHYNYHYSKIFKIRGTMPLAGHPSIHQI